MVIDTVSIMVKLTEGDEWGIYRNTEADDEQSFLLFAFDDQEEAIKQGKKIADIFNITFFLHPTASRKIIRKGKETNVSVSKCKKVMGIRKFCQRLISRQMSSDEIREAIAQKYLAAGRNEQYAKESAVWVLKEVLKNG